MRVGLALVAVCLVGSSLYACSGSDGNGSINKGASGDAGVGDDAGDVPGDDAGDIPGDDGGATTDGSKPPVDSGPFVMATHPPYPQIPNNGGGVLSGMRLVTIVASNDDANTQSAMFALSDS